MNKIETLQRMIDTVISDLETRLDVINNGDCDSIVKGDSYDNLRWGYHELVTLVLKWNEEHCHVFDTRTGSNLWEVIMDDGRKDADEKHFFIGNHMRGQLHQSLDHILDKLECEERLTNTDTFEVIVQGYTERKLILGYTCEVTVDGIQSECEVECDTMME